MNATALLAEFITKSRYEDCPEAALDAARRAILDCLGVMLAGSVEPAARILQEVARAEGGAPLATVVGTGRRTGAVWAALCNGTAAHALDFDDTNFALMGHPSAPVLAAALAAGELALADGRAVLHAFLLGFEVETTLAEVINPAHYEHGWHATCTLGTLGAAAAAARLLGLDAVETRHALAVAASQSSGLKENFGTMTKPFHPGRSAESGIVAAEFAKLGWTSTPIVLEAGRGFFKAAGGGYDPAAIEGKLGNPWTFSFPGVSIKPHPSGSLTHPGMGLMLDLIRQHDIRPDQVVKVKVGTNRHMPNALIHHRPANELQAKFSMEFCMAILLLERKAGLAEFTDKVVNSPRVKKMIGKIEFGVHPEAEAAGYEKMTTIIDIELADGRRIGGRADFGKGSPSNPMSDDELAAKFRECAAWGKLPKANADKVVDMVFSLEKLKSIRELMRLLAKK